MEKPALGFRHRKEENIEFDPRETTYEDKNSIHLSQDRV
jgi:hypothetical protein